MAEQEFTRCPGCKTIFRVTRQQLDLRGGQVRCGHCRTVFNGVAQLISLAPRPRGERIEPEFDEAALGPPTVTLREAHALEPSPRSAASPGRHADPAVEETVDGNAADDGTDPEAPYEARFSWQETQARRRLPAWVYAIAVPLLIVLLVGQALFHWGSNIIAYWPKTKPALSRLCAAAGCQLHPLQEKDGLSVEAELQADPAHKGLLILSATIKNSKPYPIAYPYLELTLSDIQRQTQQDVVVVRRDFAPQEYLSGVANLDSGIAGNGELAVKLFIDASATSQAGFLVYLFYP